MVLRLEATGRTEINGIPPKCKKKLRAVKKGEQGNGLSGEVVESPSQEKFQQCLDPVLGNLLQLVLHRAGGLD